MVIDGRDRVAMLRHDGQLVWQMKGLFTGSFRSGNHFVVQMKEAGSTEVAIEIATGRAFISSQSTSHPIGRVAAAPGLWMMLVDKPRMLVALDLAEPAKEAPHSPHSGHSRRADLSIHAEADRISQ